MQRRRDPASNGGMLPYGKRPPLPDRAQRSSENRGRSGGMTTPGSLREVQIWIAVARSGGSSSEPPLTEIVAPLGSPSCQSLEPHGVRWFEDFIHPELFDDYAAVRRQSPAPLAAGEQLATIWDFERLIRGGCVDVVQPDLTRKIMRVRVPGTRSVDGDGAAPDHGPRPGRERALRRDRRRVRRARDARQAREREDEDGDPARHADGPP